MHQQRSHGSRENESRTLQKSKMALCYTLPVIVTQITEEEILESRCFLKRFSMDHPPSLPITVRDDESEVESKRPFKSLFHGVVATLTSCMRVVLNALESLSHVISWGYRPYPSLFLDAGRIPVIPKFCFSRTVVRWMMERTFYWRLSFSVFFALRTFFSGKMWYISILFSFRGIAQLVARLLWEQKVVGSNPTTPTNV